MSEYWTKRNYVDSTLISIIWISRLESQLNVRSIRLTSLNVDRSIQISSITLLSTFAYWSSMGVMIAKLFIWNYYSLRRDVGSKYSSIFVYESQWNDNRVIFTYNAYNYIYINVGQNIILWIRLIIDEIETTAELYLHGIYNYYSSEQINHRYPSH